jgi:hypothetical protein
MHPLILLLAVCAGVEVTYDYRFAGQDKLRCNCGAPTCRGWVNAPAAADAGAPRQRPDGSILLPRSEVEFLTGAAAAAAVAAAAAAAAPAAAAAAAAPEGKNGQA